MCVRPWESGIHDARISNRRFTRVKTQRAAEIHNQCILCNQIEKRSCKFCVCVLVCSSGLIFGEVCVWTLYLTVLLVVLWTHSYLVEQYSYSRTKLRKGFGFVYRGLRKTAFLDSWFDLQRRYVYRCIFYTGRVSNRLTFENFNIFL